LVIIWYAASSGGLTDRRIRQWRPKRWQSLLIEDGIIEAVVPGQLALAFLRDGVLLRGEQPGRLTNGSR
jgi:hypothetical protein